MLSARSRSVLFAVILTLTASVGISVWLITPASARKATPRVPVSKANTSFAVAPAVNSTFAAGALVLTFTGTNNDTITIQSQNTAANDFKVNASAGTTLDGTAGNSETFTGVTSITVNGSAATGETLTFDTNSQNSVITGAISVTDVDVISLTDSTGTGSLKAASFSESGGTSATTTIGRPLLTTGAAGVSITGDTTITVNSTIDASAAASGGINLTATQNIVVNSGALIKTSDGSLTLSANQQVTPASGNFIGVSVLGATVQSTGTGVVTVSGRGGDSGSEQIGVEVASGGVISGGTTGTNTITGTGGDSSGGSNHGVIVNIVANITSAGGDVKVTGQAGASAGSSYGVAVANGSTITAGGSGTVTVMGTGANSSGGNDAGVIVNSSLGTATITSSGANVSVTGQGGSGSGGSNIGVEILQTSKITAGGSGTVTVTGTGGNTAVTSNYGVLSSTGAQVTSGGGAVSVTGTGGGSTVIGIFVNLNSSISTGNNAALTLTADGMTFHNTATVSAGNGTATLQNKSAGTAISLGGADSAGTLGLDDGELDRVKAGTLRIGRNDASASGNISLSSLIDLTAGANTIPTLHLITGAGVIDGTGTDQVDLKVGNLAIEAVTGIGASDDLDIQVTNLAFSNSGAAASGQVLVTNTGALTIAAGGVDGVVGLTRSGGSASQMGVASESPLTVNAPVSNTTGGGIGLFAGVQNSNNAADVLTINANVAATGGDGFINLGGNSLVVNAAIVSAVGAGSVVGQFGGTGGTATFNNGSLVTTVNGSIQIAANSSITLNGTATHSVTGAGNVQLTCDDIAIASTATISASDGLPNGNNVVTIQNFTAGRPINLGLNTAGTLGVTESELDRVKAETLRIGRNDASGSGNITSSALVDLTTASTAGGFTVPTLHLLTVGGVIDGISTSTNLKVQSLAVETATGIGSTNDLSLWVTNLAFRNTTSGNVQISNRGALTITAVDTVNGTAGHEIGNFAAGGTTPLFAASPITFAINTSSVGPLSATAGESLPAAPGVDNVTVNAGVTVQSTASGVFFLAGDDIVINSTGAVQAPNGNVDFRAGFSDNDNEGLITLNGSVAANSSTGTVALNLSTPGSVNEGATGSITGAGLLLLNLPAGPAGPFALNASSTNLVSTIAASTHAAINYRNNGPLSVGTVSSPPEGITSNGILTNGNNVTLATNNGALSLNQNLNAGTAIVTLITPTQINGAGGFVTAGTLNLDESSASASHTWSVIPASVTDNGGGALPYSGVTSLTVEGSTASDTFNVTPSSTTTFNIHGNDPTPAASPGDSLIVDVSGTTSPTVTKTSTPSGFQGAFTFGNRMPVNFTTIESLSCASAAPVAITCTGGITRYTDPGQTSAAVNPGSPVTSGGCGTVAVTGVRSDGQPLNARYPVGTTIITWTATDQIGNTATCTQTIIVMVPADDKRRP